MIKIINVMLVTVIAVSLGGILYAQEEGGGPAASESASDYGNDPTATSNVDVINDDIGYDTSSDEVSVWNSPEPVSEKK